MRRLRGLGFQGPFAGTHHEFLVFGEHRQTIPSNPEYSTPQLRVLLRQVETVLGRRVSLDVWNGL